MKQVGKTRKIFAWDDARKRHFEQFLKYEFAISLAVKKFAVCRLKCIV